MAETRFIDHGGKQIVLQDFSGLTDLGEELRAIAAGRAFVADLAARSAAPLRLLILTDVDGSSISPPVVNALKEMALHNKPHVLASAVVGLNALKRLVFRTVTLFSGRAISAFETREQALDWLVRQ